jgi:hypothetical protein
MARNTQALANSLEKRTVLEEELGQLQGAAWLVVTEVLGPRPGSSMLISDLSEIPSEVAGLTTDGVFHDASGVLTSSHHPTLNFEGVGRCYTTGWSAKLGAGRDSDCRGDHSGVDEGGSLHGEGSNFGQRRWPVYRNQVEYHPDRAVSRSGKSSGRPCNTAPPIHIVGQHGRGAAVERFCDTLGVKIVKY